MLLAALVLSAVAPGVSAANAEEKPGGKRPTVLLILDGYGLSEQTEHNAIALADTPVMDRLMEEYPFAKGNASGLAVGLPEGQMGSSEVGHLNMGAGRIVYQDLVRITKEIESGSFFENEALLKAMDNAKENGTSLHIFGLLSDGGVHSHNFHLYALLELAKRRGLNKVYVHCFTDGRDTPPESGKDYIRALQDEMDRIGCGRIATVAGRYYAMDRDNHWDRIEKAYRAITLGEGETADSAMEAVTQSYAKGETDEFILPTVVMENGAPTAVVGDGDSVVFYNFRSDRAKEMTRVFCCEAFDGFDRGSRKQVTYVCFTDYDATIPNKEVAFEKEEMVNTFGEWLAANGLKQARIAETEKYAHVTSFFNGGREASNEGEDRFLIPSPQVATYDLQPEMSAQAVCDTLIDKIRSGEYDVIVANFANSDMVGHTGVEKAAVEAVECLDECIGRVVETIREVDGQLFICADHGNAEVMVNEETGEPWTAHTSNPVPFILVNYDPAYCLREGGCLADIAPTLIEMMGMEKPAEMTGKSLLIPVSTPEE
ncbi:MAG: 2,3-bisphosphoglycerate-independent phosphoglycerate mutase [Clostridia bacterium]|nr:2,3-bisphosphoglycerate-independent phosphoglycerate mutase [Clostridia bacterium]